MGQYCLKKKLILYSKVYHLCNMEYVTFSADKFVNKSCNLLLVDGFPASNLWTARTEALESIKAVVLVPTNLRKGLNFLMAWLS